MSHQFPFLWPALPLKKPTLEKDISEKEKEKYQEEFEHFQQELDKKKEEFQKGHPDLQGQPGKFWLGWLCGDTWVCTVCLIPSVSAHPGIAEHSDK